MANKVRRNMLFGAIPRVSFMGKVKRLPRVILAGKLPLAILVKSKNIKYITERKRRFDELREKYSQEDFSLFAEFLNTPDENKTWRDIGSQKLFGNAKNNSLL